MLVGATCLHVPNTVRGAPHLYLHTNSYYLHDSGSDAHLCNSRSLFIEGSLRRTRVAVGGIEGRAPVICEWEGDIRYGLKGGELLLRRVLFCPDSSIGVAAGSGYEPTVLVSTSRLVKENKVGVYFVEGGCRVDIIRDNKVIHTFQPRDSGLFVDQSIMQRVSFSAHTLGEKGNKSHYEGSDSVASAPKLPLKRRLGEKERAALTKLIHKRIHNGKTQRVLAFLKEAYGERLHHEEPCDACALSHARRHPVPKKARRRATRKGERLHFDVFTSPWRSDTRCKYLLVVVDEFSDFVFCRGFLVSFFCPRWLKPYEVAWKLVTFSLCFKCVNIC